MLALGQNNLYDYRLQSLNDVQQMLTTLLDAKEKMLAQNIPVIAKMYGYLEAIDKTANEQTVNKPLLALYQAAISFLDKDLMEIFLNDPTDKTMRDALSLELLHVSASTGNLPLAKAYTPEELQEIIKGRGEAFYDDVIFVSTLRQLFESNVSGSLFSALLKTLPASVTDPDNQRMYYWDDAFILAVMLHTIWRHFFLLSATDQQFLLQNYFYQSIVVGVPIRFALSEALKRAKAKGEQEKTLRLFRESILTGKENIPQNTMLRQGKLVGDVVKEFINKSATEQINTLVQEKYISDMYRGQEDNTFFALWMRELLSIVSQLKSGDITK